MLVVTVLILATAGTSPGRAQGWTRCDGSLGTMPEAQGWTLIVDIDPVAPDVVGVAGGDLHLSTLGLAATGSTGGGVHWMRTDVPVDFSGDFAVEQDLQIVSAPDGSVNTANGWPRPGYQLEVMDIHQKVFWVGFGSGQVFLSNDVYGQYGSANTITACFNTTDRHRLYRIQRAAGGVGASLLIDGVPVLTLNSLGPTYRGGPFVMFGDGTCWANSESHTAFVRCAASEAGVGPSPSAAWLVAAPVRNPASELKLGFRAGEAGALEFECVDVAGRTIAEAKQAVAAGESGVLSAPRACPSGLYFYRVRLRTREGKAERSGRALLVR